MGFAVPLKSWFRGPLRERVRQIVTTGGLVETGIFDVAYLNTLVDQHQSGAFDHSSAIWSLMMFESFLRNVHGRNAQAQGEESNRRSAVVAFSSVALIAVVFLATSCRVAWMSCPFLFV